MALDTRTKRASAIGAGRPWMRTKEPDVTTSAAWRAASGHAYAGNAFSVAVYNAQEIIETRTISRTLAARSISRTLEVRNIKHAYEAQ